MKRTQFLRFSLSFAFLFPLSPSVRDAMAEDLPEDLTEVGLKKLLDMELTVTSPGKKEQPLSQVASAVYVLSQEDIRRSGVTNVAEALRLVPGVNVARVSSSQWAISVRGFNQVYANKLLVLIDGVTVFSPFQNGVFWQLQDLILEDIERIEVIRGPGAALWGSNAVNGVINVITKKARDTVGGLASAGGGTQERVFGTLRYGSEIDDSTSFRMGGKFTRREDEELRSNGGDARDDWNIGSEIYASIRRSIKKIRFRSSQMPLIRATIFSKTPPPFRFHLLLIQHPSPRQRCGGARIPEHVGRRNSPTRQI